MSITTAPFGDADAIRATDGDKRRQCAKDEGHPIAPDRHGSLPRCAQAHAASITHCLSSTPTSVRRSHTADCDQGASPRPGRTTPRAARGSVMPRFEFVEGWPFIAACWACLIAFAVFGGAL